jgi:hypothetical protein
MKEITNQLLKEAIADAEAVRQTAIANAKLSLEETFPQQIQTLMAKRLREESEGALEEASGNFGKDYDAPEGKAKETHAHEEDPVGGEMPADSSDIGAGDNKEPSTDAWGSSDIDQGGEDAGKSEKDWYEDWSESDFDLTEVIRELEEDISLFAEFENLGEADDEDEEEDGASGEGGDDNQNYDKHSTEKEAIDAPSAADGHKYGEPKLKMDGSKGDHGGKGMFGGEEGEDDADVDEELDLEELIRELEAEEMQERESSNRMASELAELRRELGEYRQVVGVLRSKLQEVNLLNAKLLYTNKIFRNEGLNENQKVTILETFDRAASVREVKMVYTTLVEALTIAAKSFKSRNSTQKVVTEGLASKATPSTAPKTEILEENTLAKRLQQLAGIL